MAGRILKLGLTGLLVQTLGTAVAQGESNPTWPNAQDELEALLYQSYGHNALGLAGPVTPCDFTKATTDGRSASGAMIRTAFHDAATHNAATGKGGLDASIAFELVGDWPQTKDNAGPFASSTIKFLARFLSERLSMADAIAAGLYTSVRSCQGPIIPVRGGRQDATGYGDVGLPDPKAKDVEDHFKIFKRLGFTKEEMIKLTACGHTVGNFHKQQNPDREIDFETLAVINKQVNNLAAVPKNSNKTLSRRQAGEEEDENLRSEHPAFDSTDNVFDNTIAVEYVQKNFSNPLLIYETLHSDKLVFESDDGATIQKLNDPQEFKDSCVDVMQRLIEMVPNAVQLSEPVKPYNVKPAGLQLTLGSNGTTLTFAGQIRLRTNYAALSSVSSVELVYKDRTGSQGGKISATFVGSGAGLDDEFDWYEFSSDISVTSSISGFDVVVTSGGSTVTFDNNGKSYPVQDEIILQVPSSGTTKSGDKVDAHVVVAVRSESVESVEWALHLQTPRLPVLFPELSTEKVTLSKNGRNFGLYTLFEGVYEGLTNFQLKSATYDLSVQAGGQTYVEDFKRFTDFGPYVPGAGAGPGGSSTTTTGGHGWNTSVPTPTPGHENGNGHGEGHFPGWGDYDYLDEEKPKGSKKPCGELEACDPDDWATQTFVEPRPTTGFGLGLGGGKHGSGAGAGSGKGGSDKDGAHGGYKPGDTYHNGWNGGYGGSEHGGAGSGPEADDDTVLTLTETLRVTKTVHACAATHKS